MIYYETYLYHHGVKGQKWGVRNGPPYPIKGTNRKPPDNAKENTSLRVLSDPKTVQNISLAAYGTVKLLGSKKFQEMVQKGKTAVDNILAGDVEKSFKKISKPETVEETIRKVNPNYINESNSSWLLPYNTNCGNAAISFEARLRGLDVTATGNYIGMFVYDIPKYFTNMSKDSFINPDLSSISSYRSGMTSKQLRTRGKNVRSAIEKTINSEFKENARGMMALDRSIGGHYVSWIKEGSVVKFYDAQNPDCNIMNEVFGMYKPLNKNKSCIIIRLDDKTFSKNVSELFVNND